MLLLWWSFFFYVTLLLLATSFHHLSICFYLGGNVLYKEAVHYQSHIVFPDPGDVSPHPGLVDDQVHPPLPPPDLVTVEVNAIKVNVVVDPYRE